MFTGIVQEIGRVEKVLKQGALTKLGINGRKIWEESVPSDSIAVNGACLTLIYKDRGGTLYFEAMRSTLAKTGLGSLKRGDFVNLEPALKVGDKLGGHFVLGHIDCQIRLRKIINRSGYKEWQLELPSRFKKWVVANGSLALDGISLTIKKVLPSQLRVDIIPFTYANTNLKYRKLGDKINIEFDYLLKQKAS